MIFRTPRFLFSTAMGMTAVALMASSSSFGAKPKTITFAMTTEPPTLNTLKATDQQSGFVIGHVMEGLTRNGKDGKKVPGVAESWTINDQGASFKLRKNALWSDGRPVTAKDFVFAWRTALDPRTASEYAFILYPIKNAEKINQGKLSPMELGVSAPDDFTLTVTFEKPCGYFVSLTSFPTYFPVREDFYKTKKDRYAADASDLLFNGPFVLSSWVHGASLRMDKNPTYWNAEAIQIDRIDIPYITSDNTARFNFYKERKTDFLETLSKDDLPRAQAERFKMKNHTDGSLWFMEFNFAKGRPTANLNLRKAIQAMFNPSEYVNKVIGIPGTKPGLTLIPSWMPGKAQKFRKEYPYTPAKRDLAQARAYLEAAKKELGGTIPPLIWLTGDTPTSAREAEYFQSQFKTHLGIDLKIDKQIFKQRLAKMTAGEFDIVSAGWGPDFNDPMTFADLMTSWNDNNRGKYKNTEVDRLIREAQGTSDPTKRMDAMAKAEQILLSELAILPTYERATIWTHHQRVDGIQRNAVGVDPDLTQAIVKD